MIEVYTNHSSIFLHEDQNGKWSEITPIPGYNSESLSEALKALFEGDFSLYPSVAFATDILYCDTDDDMMEYASLRTGTPDEILHAPPHTSHVKIKVGDFCLEQTLELTHKLLEKGLTLRLDFSNRWAPSDVQALADAFPPNTFEFFEDPTSALPIEINQPIALDQNCMNQNLWPYVDILVIKPPVIGSVGDCLELYQNAKKKIVISNPYQTTIGLRSILRFHRLLPPSSLIPGLGKVPTFSHPKDLERIGVVSAEPAPF